MSASAGSGARRPRRGVRRAYTAVLAGLGAFAAVQLGLALAYLAWPLEMRDPCFAERLACLRARVAAKPRPFTVVFLGSSRVHMGVRAGQMEAPLSAGLDRPVVTFNLGIGGGGPQRSLLYWHRLRRHGVRPDLLVVEVLPALLSDAYDDFTEPFCPTATLSWDDLAVLEWCAGQRRAGARRDWLLGLVCPWHSQRRALLSSTFPSLLAPAMRQGKLPSANTSGDFPLGRGPVSAGQRAQGVEVAREEYAERLAALPNCRRGLRALRALLAACRKEGVPVALLITPEGPRFRSLYRPGSWRAVRRRLDALAGRFGADLIDARAWLNGEESFLDSHHLTLAAAERFSRRLARDELLPLLDRSGTPHGRGPVTLGRAR